MVTSKFIAATLLAGVSLAASADRRDEHYSWDRTVVAQAPARTQHTAAPDAAQAGRPLEYGARDARFVIAPSVRRRAEVIAELREASRLGLLSAGEADVQIATTAQQAQITTAGQAAASGGIAAHR